MKLTIIGVLLLVLMGCSDLIVREADTGGVITGKVATRALLCPLTLCFSELGIADQKEREARQMQNAEYWRWVRSLPPEEQAREYRLEEARILATGQAMLGLGIGGGPFRNGLGPRHSSHPSR
jgi:hypothetical protein